MKKIFSIEELSFDAQRSITGGEATAGCSSTCADCSCSCSEDQNSSNIESKTDSTTKKVTEGLHARLG